MKNLILAAAFLTLGANVAKAQQSNGFEGRTFLMGSVGYSTEKDNGTDITTDKFTILPTVGYFVAPTIAVGLGIGYQDTTIKQNDLNTKISNGAFKLTPLARKYWGLGDKLYFFGQLAVPMEFGTTKLTAGNNSTKNNYSSFGVQFAPGLDYFLTNNWSVEATVGALGYSTSKVKGGKSTDSFEVGVKSNIQLGVKYIF